jgi:hypothetical protein
MKSIPTKLEVIHFKELAGKFSGSKNFVQEFIDTFEIFYEKVVQNLEAWKPKPPKIENKTEYYYYLHDTNITKGPIKHSKLLKEISNLEISNVSIWHEGLSNWEPLANLHGRIFKQL